VLKKIALFVVLLMLAGGAVAWWGYRRVSTPYQGYGASEVFVELPPGVGVPGIASRLAGAGVIPDPLTFRLVVRAMGADRHLQAGEYRFAGPATTFEIIDRLSRGDVYRHPLTFPEGLTIQEMAALFEQSGLGTAAAYSGAASDASLIADLDPDAATLEGYLFPDTYALGRHAGAAGAVGAMVARFRAAFGPAERSAAAAAQLSPREVVTLASIVEKETAAPAERPIVAAVYLNRLKHRMPLQCDPTVIYALMQAGRWRGNLRREDLQMNSPYNTYRFAGLPPGPIASPGQAAIDAVLHPADVPYLYFVSRNDGTHVFASTLQEHNRNVATWQVRFFQRGRK
jgi:UPF0755 protein